ncbi:MAG: 50S ribosomal protein L6 [Marinilabiliales bacterium]|nr:50S ribosomal protein L6 [Marinilabiliales bacterium]
MEERHKSLHGLYRALIANMVAGVSTGLQEGS